MMLFWNKRATIHFQTPHLASWLWMMNKLLKIKFQILIMIMMAMATCKSVEGSFYYWIKQICAAMDVGKRKGQNCGTKWNQFPSWLLLLQWGMRQQAAAVGLFQCRSSMDRDELEQIDGPIFDISSQLRWPHRAHHHAIRFGSNRGAHVVLAQIFKHSKPGFEGSDSKICWAEILKPSKLIRFMTIER